MGNKNVKKIALILVACLTVVGVASTTWAYVGKRREIKAEELRIEKEKKEEEETKRKEEEEKKKYNVGVSNEGKKYTYDAKKVAEKLKNYDYSNNGEKVVFLTFDDGASVTNTPKVLDILKENDVKATFFVLGECVANGGDRAKELIKREFNEGHAIGNHSYSHDMSKLYPGRVLDIKAFKEDFEKNEQFLKEILGENFTTKVIRCPGGYGSWKKMEPLDKYLKESDMTSIDWNALNADAEGKKKNAKELANFAIKTSEGKEMVVVLMHDTYSKEETVKALPKIIKYFKDNGYEFKTLS